MSADARLPENPAALTPVDEHVQCAAPGARSEVPVEEDDIEISALIETLARIAHAVATRTANRQQQEETEL